MSKWSREIARVIAFCGVILVLAVPAAAQQQPKMPPQQAVMPHTDGAGTNSALPMPQPGMPGPVSNGGNDYVLGVGDKLQITVFNEDDLSGDFIVSSTGTISMPLIGEVVAGGQTSGQVQATIVNKLSNGYMKDPHVSLQVSTYRPFFIVGEVMKPGSYTYVNGMSVINAVALAGGYTYRADKDDIKLKHGGGKDEKQVDESTTVQPGDVITIPERFF